MFAVLKILMDAGAAVDASSAGDLEGYAVANGHAEGATVLRSGCIYVHAQWPWVHDVDTCGESGACALT